MMNKYQSYEVYIIFVLIFCLIFSWFFNTIHLENIDVDILQRIINPFIEKGSVVYDPHYNYLYFLANIVNFKEIDINESLIIKFIWASEKILFIIIAHKILKFFFKEYNFNILIIFSIIYLILQRGGEVDQKTLALPFQFLAIFYFLRGKFLKSSISISFVFYLHVGMGVWWYLPSIISYLYLFYKKNENFNAYNFLKYNIYIIFFILPLFYYYFLRENNIQIFYSSYIIEYWIGINNSLYYLLNQKSYNEVYIILSKIIIFYISITILFNNENKLKSKFFSIFLGIILIYVINEFIFFTLLNGFVLKLQLLRSIEILNFFSIFFLSVILFYQIKRKNFIYFFLFLILLIPNPIWIILKQYNFYMLFYTLWLMTLVSELVFKKIQYKKHINNLKKKLDLILTFIFFKKHYFYITIIFLLFANLNYYYNLQDNFLSLIFKKNTEKIYTKEISEKNKMLAFINNDLRLNNALVVIPFTKGDLGYLIKKQTFVNTNDPYDYIPKKTNLMVKVFNKELNLTVDDVRSIDKMNKVWSNFNEDKFIEWKIRYGITHIIRQNYLPLNFPIIYRNNEYYIYKIKDL